jgi:uncharacterized protein (TIGR03083 family)
MTQLTAADYAAQIEAGAAALGALVDGGDLAMPIPSCPDWTLRELAIHVGRVHRWAAAITAARATEPVAFRSLPDGRFPDDPAQRPGWLTAGARRAAAAIGEAGQDEVWAFGTMAPASFWGRRMSHETMVHAADGLLAAGQEPGLPPALTADAIDEWLVTMMPRVAGPAGEAALAPGTALHVQAAGDGPGGAGDWLIRAEPAGVTVTRGPGPADAVLAGPPARLLLVLLRRVPAGDPAVTVSGDAGVVGRWLAGPTF